MDDPPQKCDGEEYVLPKNKAIFVQLWLSLILGVSAFLAFCVSPFPTDRVPCLHCRLPY